ncbi:MAG: PAS domain-containing protein, partial [Anaerolineae bacterium]|nr:PAS domain-containing protein [Anaerolineae bacterium]
MPPPSAFELDTLLKNVPGYIAVIDADLKLTTVYGTQGQIVRSLLETTGTRHWPELFALEVRPHVEQALQQAIATGAATTFEACLMPTAGDSIWFEHQVKPQSASGTVTSLIIAATDITSRKQLERQRQEQQRFIDGVLNTVQGWVVVYDHRAQKMVFANRNMIDFHGLPLGETEYHTYLTRETIHPDDYERVVDHGTRELINLKDGEIASIEFRGLAADGTWRWIDVRDSVLKRHADGTVWQTLGVAIDVTEHKLAEARLLDIERRYQA